MNNIKIRLIGTAYPYRGGLAAFNERLTRELLKSTADVAIETFTLQYPAVLFPGKTQYAGWLPPKDLLIRRSVNSVNPLNWIRTGFRIRRESPGLVLIKYWMPFMSPCFSTIARIIRRNRKTKVICIADNIIPHEKRPGDKMLTRIFMNSIDGIVTMSKSVAADAALFRKDLPTRLSPHPLFDDFGEIVDREVALSNLSLDPDYRYILFFGFIRDYKGLDWLLEAYSDPRIQLLPVKLIIAGEFYGPAQPYLDQIAQLNIAGRVILRTEFIANSEVNNYFCASDLVVQPYKQATQSGVTQIGYYFEKPMVVTNVGGLPEIIPHMKAGYVVEPAPPAIAGAIVDFFQHNRAGEFLPNVREEKQKYQWDNMVKAISEVYNETLM